MSQFAKKWIKSLPGFRRVVEQRDQLFIENHYLRQKVNEFVSEKAEREKQLLRFETSVEILRLLENRTPILENFGYCNCCESSVKFASYGDWWREDYFCLKCGCIARERAVMACVERHFPEWRSLTIHESSPIPRGASVRLKKECPGYTDSQYYPDVEPGKMGEWYRCENLEGLTFEDNSIDLFVTQDVFEHLFHPEKAFQEIARVLKPGGAHIFTTPLVNKNCASVMTAKLREDNTIEHLVNPPEYHGNPVSSDGSLLTVRWGYDICEMISRSSGLFSQIESVENLDIGIKAESNEVIVSRKPTV